MKSTTLVSSLFAALAAARPRHQDQYATDDQLYAKYPQCYLDCLSKEGWKAYGCAAKNYTCQSDYQTGIWNVTLPCLNSTCNSHDFEVGGAVYIWLNGQVQTELDPQYVGNPQAAWPLPTILENRKAKRSAAVGQAASSMGFTAGIVGVAAVFVLAL
ncbi:hypothetical protein F5Y10DRAFT_273004 [Nemania abortiva]|nr:hypothetical protein F5Y10DRAFT_273004 [Nemania abortiva]